MELEQIKKLIDKVTSSKKRKKFVKRAIKARRYYRCKNDILEKKRGHDPTKPFQKTNHKIPSNFYRLLVIQKMSYLFGVAPVFDVGHPETNKKIQDILGDKFKNVCKELCKNASNDSKAWLQYWVDEEGFFHYGVIDTLDVYDIWGGRANNELLAVLVINRGWIDEEGNEWDSYEYWDKENCYAFRSESGASIDEIEEDYQFWVLNANTGSYSESYVYNHGFGEVPFLCFRNNSDELNDLTGIKQAIDSYDESRSGLQDDIADCEEVIFVLSGYGDQDPHEFWQKVSENRLIKLVNDPLDAQAGAKSSAELLAIEPPINATVTNLELQRKAIFEQGMGVDPTPDNYGNTSGEALKHMYNLLMLKAASMRNEFEIPLSKLVKAICRHIGFALNEQDTIEQTWTPTMISNETETITNIKNSIGLLSTETLLRNHPYVDDVEYEKELIEAEKEKDSLDMANQAIDTYVQRLNQLQAGQNEENKAEDENIAEEDVNGN